MQAHLDRIVAEAIDTSQQLIKKHVTLEKRIAQNVPVITADKRKLMQILYNLIGNAAKFTSKGSILVDVKLEPGGQEVPASPLHVLLGCHLQAPKAGLKPLDAAIDVNEDLQGSERQSTPYH